jgi:hypothetical protein
MNGVTTEQKLDHLIQLIEGDGEAAPGVVARLSNLEVIMYGDRNERSLGVRTKVTIMWRAHIWLLCTGSAALGWAARSLFHL